MKSKVDMRVERSRRLLKEALLQLMKQKSFRDIQVTEIADQAQVARPTFYLHYQSKQELLLSHVDDVFNEFYEALSATLGSDQADPKQQNVMVFQYWERYADILRMVIEADIHDEFRTRMRVYFSQVMAQFVPDNLRTDDPRIEFIIDFVSGGAYSLLTQWIMRDMPYSAEQMGALFHELTGGYENILKSNSR